MTKPFDFSRAAFAGIVTSACSLSGIASNLVEAGDPRFRYHPHAYTLAARTSLNQQLNQQVDEGRLLSQTIWNYHFHEESDVLRPAGRQLLESLARRYPQGYPQIYIQSANDIRLRDDKIDDYFAQRRELDAERLKAVTAYLRLCLPDQLVAVQFHNRPAVWIGSDEVIRGQAQLRASTSGLLPPSVTASSFSFGAGGGGGMGDFGGGPMGGPGGQPAPILSGGSEGPGFAPDIPTGMSSPSAGPQPGPSPGPGPGSSPFSSDAPPPSMSLNLRTWRPRY